MFELEFCEGPIEEEELNHNDILNVKEEEELISKLYKEEVRNGQNDEVRDGGFNEGQDDDMQGGSVHKSEGPDVGVLKVMVFMMVEDKMVRWMMSVMNEGGMVGCVSFDDSEEESLNYDNAFEVLFDDSNNSADGEMNIIT